MAIEQRARRELEEALVETIGPNAADTMMESLPPFDWSQVATKTDLTTGLTSLSTQIHARIDGLQAATQADIRVLTKTVEKLAEVTNEKFEKTEERIMKQLHKEMRTQFYWLITIMFLMLGAFTAIIRLT